MNGREKRISFTHTQNTTSENQVQQHNTKWRTGPKNPKYFILEEVVTRRISSLKLEIELIFMHFYFFKLEASPHVVAGLLRESSGVFDP
jgi:hypothetical protein